MRRREENAVGTDAARHQRTPKHFRGVVEILAFWWRDPYVRQPREQGSYQPTYAATGQQILLSKIQLPSPNGSHSTTSLRQASWQSANGDQSLLSHSASTVAGENAA